ncbi:MAG: GNAT family N-acetyltransferase, partial [Candidatus Fermentibacter daniensis]|nr:GNAT family N-acetyltransferase [Candidatus Fermentibacter daniensis]
SATAVYSFLGGTREEFFELRPNNLLKHRIVLWARDAGYESFLLGGGPGGEDGIFDYKKSFAPEGILDFHLACRVHDESLYGTLVERCMERPRTAVPGAERYFLRWRYGG